jgi:hypothetical protein
MKVKVKRRFVLELDDAELNQFFDWLAEKFEKDRFVNDIPKIVYDLKNQLHGHRHGI